MLNIKKYSLLGMLFVTMGVSAQNNLIIDNSSIQGDISPWGGMGVPNFGQVIKIPEKYNVLDSFTFYIKPLTPSLPQLFTSYVYKWDNNLNRPIGDALFRADGTLNTNVINEHTPVTIQTNHLTLDPNQSYVIFLSAQVGGANVYGWASNPNNYGDGKFVYSFNPDFSQNWMDIGALDLAFLINLLQGISREDTLASMQYNASGLRQIFTLQSDALNDNLNQSCDYFNQDKFCLSFTGKYTTTNESNDTNATSGIVNVAYKVSPHFYVGGSLEQIVSDIETQGVSYRQKAPDLGIYTGWTQKENGDGWLARVAYRHSNGQLSVQREITGTVEPGFGQTELSSDGYQLSIGNAVRLSDKSLFTPYAGVRYSEIERHSYSEKLTDDVTLPLHYDDLGQKVTTAFAAAKFDTHLSAKLALTGSFGIEKDLDHEVDEYSAVGVDGLDSIKFDDYQNDIRAVASLGLNYIFSKNQQLGVQAAYREQAYDPSSATSAYVSYTTSF